MPSPGCEWKQAPSAAPLHHLQTGAPRCTPSGEAPMPKSPDFEHFQIWGVKTVSASVNGLHTMRTRSLTEGERPTVRIQVGSDGLARPVLR